MSPSVSLPRLCHGVDLVEIGRLREIMQRNTAFEARVFTEGECAFCNARADPVMHFAARFAAKEAALKALGLGITPIGIDGALQDVEVDRQSGPPRLLLHGKVAAEAERLGIASTSVSLTHTDAYAVASVVMLGVEPAPSAGEGTTR